MRRVKRTAITVKPKQPYIEWANGLEEGGVKLGEDFTPELNVYLVEDIADAILDIEAIVAPHYEAIFEEELVAWHRRASDWPQRRDLATFLAWFEVEIHSIVLDLAGGWLCKERYVSDRL
jgi:hypothetical protein